MHLGVWHAKALIGNLTQSVQTTSAGGMFGTDPVAWTMVIVRGLSVPMVGYTFVDTR